MFNETFSNVATGGGVVGDITSGSVKNGVVYIENALSVSESVGAVAGKANSSDISYNTVNTYWTAKGSLSGKNVGGIVGLLQNGQQTKENRVTNLTLNATNGGVGQIYGSLEGSGNLSNNMYREVTLNASSSQTNNLGGSEVNDIYIDLSTGVAQVIQIKWMLV